jgi:hypothetical protein
MSMHNTRLVVAVALGLLPLTALQAQQSAAPPAAAQPLPSPDQLEPGVATSSAAGTPAAPTAAAPAPSAAPTIKSAAGKAPAARGSAADGAAPRKAGVDKVQLGTTDITGNRELPKVLYIVPWKRSDLGDLTGKPVNSLLDEVLQPVDRDVFRRENRYYDALKPGESAPKAGDLPASGDKP